MSTVAHAIQHVAKSTAEWEDLRFPLIGRNIDVTSGRIAYDYYNGTVSFATNARYHLNETISFIVQMPHAWAEGMEIRPHLHWLQQDATEPNWLLGYQIHKKNTIRAALETDFSNHTKLIKSSNVFTYTSNILEQITTFPAIDMTGYKISDILHVCL